jgi:hypothetical protein
MQLKIIPQKRHIRFRNTALRILSYPFRPLWDRYKNPSRPISHPRYKPLELPTRKRSAQTQSVLLSLPAELRLMIWEYVVARDPIVLYRRNGRIGYAFLEGKGMREVGNITPRVLEQVKEDRGFIKGRKAKKVHLLAVPQTCQMMYMH